MARRRLQETIVLGTILFALFGGITFLIVRTAQSPPPEEISTALALSAPPQALPRAFSGAPRPTTAEAVAAPSKLPTRDDVPQRTDRTLGQRSFGRVMQAQMPAFRRCYEQQLREEPDLEGRVTLHLVIDSSGHVSSARAHDDTLDNEEVGPCLVRVARGLHFPAPRGGSFGYAFPFVFQPGT